MQAQDIAAMNHLFEEQKPAQVLEFGAGGSTVYWPTKYGFIERWVAVEHSSDVVQALSGKTASSVRVTFVSLDDFSTPDVEGKFDLIIVDGHDRLGCMEAARGFLAPGGVVVLHDAQRVGYQTAWQWYDHAETLTEGRVPDERGGFKRDGLVMFWNDFVEVDEALDVEQKPEPEIEVIPAATQAAQSLAMEYGLDLALVEGTGDGGRVVLPDVRRAIENVYE